MADADHVLVDLKKLAGDRDAIAILSSERARPFIAAVLEEIKHPTAGEDEPTTEGA